MNFPQYKEFRINNALEIVSLYTISKRIFSADYSFDGESHDFCELVCCSSGRIGVTVDSTAYMLSSGQIIIHRPNEFHRIWSDGESSEVIVLSFRATELPQTSGIYNITERQLKEINNLFDLSRNIFEYTNVIERIYSGMDVHASILLKRLELLLLQIITGTPASNVYCDMPTSQLYSNIISIMKKYLNRSLPLSKIAEECNASISAIEKTIHKFTGHGAKEHFIFLKMNRAISLLKSGVGVKQTAYTLGYSDPNYFSNLFKKYVGSRPTEIKNMS